MRIQHNITAMNSYRNYASNTRAVSKNLEKLSSGYRINRAGDDAAGLAISEKMRAQITGLKTAQKNAKDGISLIQTAEGALTEVHSMLNRMSELAEQSANGTYDNEVDRANLQKEVSALKTEIDRIADSSNFNGIKLLNGSLGSTSASGVAVDVKYSNLASNADLLTLNSATATTSAAAAGAGAFTAGTNTVELKYADADGNLQVKTVSFTAEAGALSASATNRTALQTEMQKAFGDGYTVAIAGTGALTITSNNNGSDDKLEVFSLSAENAAGTSVAAFGAITNTSGTDAFYTLDTQQLTAFDGTGEADIFEINGQKFAFTNASAAKDLDSDVHYVAVGTDDAIDNTDTAAMITLINDKTGIGAVVNATDTSIDLKAGEKTAASGNGLTLQIGDTAEKFNKLTVSVGDMHVSALGIKGVDIGTQAGGAAAMEKIKNAINSVSSTRGDLGALQNRLDHTINNLAVMTENIQDAEATIRDTDVAEEMMAYTKNNILVQSAQAMLAQANQLPQGVLQLLG